jgi:hypothetical protein
MEQSLIVSIDNYYELKQKYDNQFVDLKKKIKKNTELNKREKHRLFQKFQPKCVNCEKVGGTLFTSKDRVLKAVCSAKEPCKLDIIINIGKYANIINLDENYSKNIDAIKSKIIMTKLDFLFGYISDENAAFDNFDQLRKNLGNYTQAQLLVQKRYNDVAHNVKKNEEVSLAQIKLYEEINELKEIYKQYKEDSKVSYIVEMVDRYNNILQPLADKIRNMKYIVTVIEYEYPEKQDSIAYLVEKVFTLNELEQEVYGDVKSGVVKK